MEWQQIMGFYHVARSGSCSRAAEATFRTQSAVSQQIKKLESELDCQLFKRVGKKRLLLTVEGEVFFKFAQQVLRGYDDLVAKIDFINNRQAGLIKIASPPDILDYLLPPYIAAFQHRLPAVTLQPTEMPPQRVIDSVRNGDADIGITVETLVPKDLVTIRWKTAMYLLFVCRGHELLDDGEISLEKMVRHPLIVPSSLNRSRSRATLLGELDRLGLDYAIGLEASNIHISLKYAAMNFGVYFSLCTQEIVDERPAKLEYIALRHIFNDEYISLVLRKDKPLTGVFKSFVDALLAKDDILPPQKA